MEISIHAPHAGCDAAAAAVITWRRPFQSTHPMRGATDVSKHLNDVDIISIHAPHAGCDAGILGRSDKTIKFQSTHPMRGATRSVSTPILVYSAFQSTHPMRGATRPAEGRGLKHKYFNPRTPCGVRQPTCTKTGTTN